MNEATESNTPRGTQSLGVPETVEATGTPCKMKRPRGFALLTPARRKEISSMGGKSVPDEKRMFSRSKDFAATCGRKGGQAVTASKRTFSRDRDAASIAGKKGVQVRREHKRERADE